MSLFVSEQSTGKTYPPAPTGVHRAACVHVIDLGMQMNIYKNEPQRQVKINFELVDEKKEDGSNFVIGKFYTLSLHKEANLRKDLDVWRGRPFTAEELKKFDLGKILGAPCQLSIIQYENKNGDTKAKISGIMPLSKGMEKPKPTNDLLIYNTDEPDPAVFAKLDDYHQGLISNSGTQQPVQAEPVTQEPQEQFDEEIAF